MKTHATNRRDAIFPVLASTWLIACTATGELGGSLLTSLLALFMPLLALAFVVLFCWLSVKLIRRLFRRAPKPMDAAK